jgi:hypothetical protein
MRVFPIALAVFLTLAAPASAASTTLVINEVDYDQPSTDTAEFVELRNIATATVNLDPYALRFINGANDLEYRLIDLPDVDLAAGARYVVCANAANTPHCDQDVTPDTDLIQNGAPDAFAIVNGATIVDALSYEGVVAGFSEGATAPSDTGGAAATGISRVPDGCDTDDNSADFDVVATRPSGRPAPPTPRRRSPPAARRAARSTSRSTPASPSPSASP